MNARRLLNISATVIVISLIWGGVAALLVASENYWWAAIPVAIWLLTIRNLWRYYTRTHPKLITADENAVKGLTLKLLLMTMIFSVFSLALLYVGVDERFLSWLVWPFVFSMLAYVMLRQRRFRKIARESFDKTGDGAISDEKDLQ